MKNYKLHGSFQRSRNRERYDARFSTIFGPSRRRVKVKNNAPKA